MKCLHLSDLHLGKRLIEVSLLEDQAYILDQIARIAEAERPDAVLIAGDVYDRSSPSAEAMVLFGRFLGKLTRLIGVISHVDEVKEGIERRIEVVKRPDGTSHAEIKV